MVLPLAGMGVVDTPSQCTSPPQWAFAVVSDAQPSLLLFATPDERTRRRWLLQLRSRVAPSAVAAPPHGISAVTVKERPRTAAADSFVLEVHAASPLRLAMEKSADDFRRLHAALRSEHAEAIDARRAVLPALPPKLFRKATGLWSDGGCAALVPPAYLQALMQYLILHPLFAQSRALLRFVSISPSASSMLVIGTV